MKRASFGWIIAVVLAAHGNTARSDEVPTVADVRAALTQRRISEGYQLAERLVAARPADPDAAFLAGDACMRMAQLEKAKLYVDVALRTSPDDARLHGILARVAVMQGDDGTARKQATLALATNGKEVLARQVMDELELLDRFERQPQPGTAAGSPTDLVVKMAGLLSTHAPPSAFAPLIDPSIFLGLPPVVMGEHDPVEQVIDGLYDYVKSGEASITAWEPGHDLGDGVVPVQLLVEIRWTAGNLSTLRRSLETGAAFGLIPTAELLNGIAPADKELVLSRMIGARQRSLTTIKVHVAKIDHELKITDLELAGTSLREQLIRSMTQLAKEFNRRGIDPRRHSTSYWFGYYGGLAVVVVIVALLLRHRRRRR